MFMVTTPEKKGKMYQKIYYIAVSRWYGMYWAAETDGVRKPGLTALSNKDLLILHVSSVTPQTKTPMEGSERSSKGLNIDESCTCVREGRRSPAHHFTRTSLSRPAGVRNDFKHPFPPSKRSRSSSEKRKTFWQCTVCSKKIPASFLSGWTACTIVSWRETTLVFCGSGQLWPQLASLHPTPWPFLDPKHTLLLASQHEHCLRSC